VWSKTGMKSRGVARLARLALASPTRLTRIALLIVGVRGWEPVVRLAIFVPLRMRYRAEDGRWIYRDPTEAEILEFLASEAR
jgi:hypothetical protein